MLMVEAFAPAAIFLCGCASRAGEAGDVLWPLRQRHGGAIRCGKIAAMMAGTDLPAVRSSRWKKEEILAGHADMIRTIRESWIP